MDQVHEVEGVPAQTLGRRHEILLVCEQRGLCLQGQDDELGVGRAEPLCQGVVVGARGWLEDGWHHLALFRCDGRGERGQVLGHLAADLLLDAPRGDRIFEMLQDVDAAGLRQADENVGVDDEDGITRLLPDVGGELAGASSALRRSRRGGLEDMFLGQDVMHLVERDAGDLSCLADGCLPGLVDFNCEVEALGLVRRLEKGLDGLTANLAAVLVDADPQEGVDERFLERVKVQVHLQLFTTIAIPHSYGLRSP